MKIPLDRQSPQPLYLQIRDHLRHLIMTRVLKPGDRLPSLRTLAKHTHINQLTAIEAYSALEGELLIYARRGVGYFVSPNPDTALDLVLHSTTSTPSRFHPRQEVIIQDQGDGSFCEQFSASLRLQSQPDIIDFSSGFTHLGEQSEFRRLAKRAINQAGDELLRYGLPEGQPLLQRQISQMLIQQGLDVLPDDLLITHGSEQGISLVMNHYLHPGDWVVVESPTYHGAIATLDLLGARMIGIPMTADGMNLDLLERYLHSHCPKLIYTISTLHNPTGITTPQAHRHRLLALAHQHNCLIVEDNAYEGLSFNLAPPPIKAIDRGDRVIYIGTFSKTLMPGLRVGYVVLPRADRTALIHRKILQDFHVSTLSQAVVSEYLSSGYYRRHINRLNVQNLQRRNLMLQALSKHFPPTTSWTIPAGGIFLWVHSPHHLPMAQICDAAFVRGVRITSGSVFFPRREGYTAMRLNFSLPPDDIERGIAIIGDVLDSHRAIAS